MKSTVKSRFPQTVLKTRRQSEVSRNKSTFRKERARSPGTRPGAVLLEFAIMLPLLILIVVGCVDFGRFLYYYAVVTNAAQEGASFGSLNPPINVAWTESVTAAALAETSGFLPEATDANVTVIDTLSDDPAVPGYVTVQVQYPFSLVSPGAFSLWGLPTTMMLSRTVVMPHTR